MHETRAALRNCPMLRLMRVALSIAAVTFAVISSGPATASFSQGSSPPAYTAWVADSLRKMETITPGMTRADLRTVFITEGGLLTRTTRTYVSLDCPHFKVDVRFRPVGSTGATEGEMDVITSISRPYLARPILD